MTELDIWARIIADGVHAATGRFRLTTMLVQMPRCILAEFNTHRVLSRNAASSRAIPVSKMIERVMQNPFVPKSWGKNQKGMQASEEHSEAVKIWDHVNGERKTLSREAAWLVARDRAVQMAEAFEQAGYHKQIINRLLEPWMYTIVCVTATEWSNFFALRRLGAEPHMEFLANRMWDAREASEPAPVGPDEWQLPFVMQAEKRDLNLENQTKISVARCASTSYKTVDGFDMTLERATELYQKMRMAKPLHASPFEHQAMPDRLVLRNAGSHGWERDDWDQPYAHGNFKGWIQLRKTMPGESA